MNEVNALLADRKGFKFVSVVFAPYTGKATYTYKTLFDVKEDDYAVVDTPSKGFQVVQVRKVIEPFEVDLAVNYSYKWLVSPIDLTAYDEAAKFEADLLVEVNKANKANKAKNALKMAEVKERLLSGLDTETQAKLLRL